MKRSRLLLMIGLILFLWGCDTQNPGITTAGQTSPVTGAVQTTTPGTTTPTTLPDTTTPSTTTPATTPSTTTAQFPQDPDPVGAFWPTKVDVITHLDNDGELDTIFFSKDDFRINGVSYKSHVQQDVYQDDDPNFEKFIIADLDTRDDHRDIGLMVRGPSDDPAVFFYTIRGQDLVKLGEIPTEIRDPGEQFDGKSQITSPIRLGVLQTWFAEAVWELKEEQIIQLVPDQMLIPIKYDYMEPVFLKKDLPIYKNKGDAQSFMKLEPQEVEFLATDNKSWVQVKGLTGDTGWFKVEQFDYLPDLNKDARDVFDGLSSAD